MVFEMYIFHVYSFLTDVFDFTHLSFFLAQWFWKQFFFRYNPMLNFATTPYFSSGPILSEVLEFKRTWIYSNEEFHFKQSCSMVFEKDFSLFIPLLKFSSSPPRVVNSTLKGMIQTNLSLHHRRMLLHIFCLAKWCLIRLQVIFFSKCILM